MNKKTHPDSDSEDKNLIFYFNPFEKFLIYPFINKIYNI